jgi:hypothetical protein
MASKEVAKADKGQVPANYEYDSDEGFEDISSNDLSIPFLNLLQKTSPEVENQTVPGAEPGAILNSVTQEIISGETGFVFVPVHRDEQWVEWVPRNKGGGFVAQHDPSSELVQNLIAKNNGSRMPPKDDEGKRIMFKNNGNEVIETYYMYGLILDDLGESVNGFAVMSFASTKIKPFKDWTTSMFMLRVGGKRPPIFANRARIRTTKETRPSGTSFNYLIQAFNGTWVNSLVDPKAGAAVLQSAMDFREMILSGTAKADMTKQESVAGDGETPF